MRGVIAKETDRVLASFEAVVAPTRPDVASRVDRELRKDSGTSRGDIIGAVGNAAGLPAVSVPSGFSDEGLPTGIQFHG